MWKHQYKHHHHKLLLIFLHSAENLENKAKNEKKINKRNCQQLERQDQSWGEKKR